MKFEPCPENDFRQFYGTYFTVHPKNPIVLVLQGLMYGLALADESAILRA